MMLFTSYLMSRVHIDQISLVMTILTVIARNSPLSAVKIFPSGDAMSKFLKWLVKFCQLKSDS